jgi:hypothetical protein
MKTVITDSGTYEVNPCPHCKNDTIEYCPPDEPWNTEKWACNYCDSTYVIFNIEIAKLVENDKH